MEGIVPSEAHLKLFREIFLKRWKHAHERKLSERNALEASLRAYRDRASRVLNLFIEGSLSVEEKQIQTQKIDRVIMLQQSELKELKGETIDAEILIDSAMRLMKDAAVPWQQADAMQRRKLQEIIFPEGLAYSFVDGFGTAKTSELYGVVRDFDMNNSNLVGHYARS